MDQKPEQIIEQAAFHTEIESKELSLSQRIKCFITIKSLLVILVFFLIIILTAGSIYFTVNKAEKADPELTTANAKTSIAPAQSTPSSKVSTYKGEGYTIHIPQGFTIKEDRQFNWELFRAIENGKEKAVFISRNKSPMKDPCRLSKEGYDKSMCTSVNGYRALDWGSHLLPYSMGPLQFAYSLIQNEKEYKITFTNFTETEKDQILSSLKFTDASHSAKVILSGWKTISSPVVDGLGYSLKVPSNWGVFDEKSYSKQGSPTELGLLIKGNVCNTKKEGLGISHTMSSNQKESLIFISKTLLENGYTPTKISLSNGTSADIYSRQESHIQDKTPYISHTSFILSSKGYYRINYTQYCSLNDQETLNKILTSFTIKNS